MHKCVARGEGSHIFAGPVLKSVAPDYYRVVKAPMDLATMRHKINDVEYHSRHEYLADIRQLCFNALHYNGTTNGIYNMACGWVGVVGGAPRVEV